MGFWSPVKRFWPFKRRRRSTHLDQLGPATIYPEQRGAYHLAVGVARVPLFPERPLLTLAGEFRAGLWSWR
ncbi:hypothetical protein O7606_20895 [Micromonospora sp. WMMD882]|uniref:hypothetical protein n=1 Tax=Micromonospora sp. WMMD882 TaxID=3015151 RepID=UPI00248CECFC|nr:hypothetical protein [Micromonospora sp. WMMD882]WBB78646.1 hypothetical protein O7606_20895 [Micromonospora sp. WMMD882]